MFNVFLSCFLYIPLSARSCVISSFLVSDDLQKCHMLSEAKEKFYTVTAWPYRVLNCVNEIVHRLSGQSWLGFCTLCFCFPAKILYLNATFFPLKCSVSPKKSLKCLDNAHYTNGFLKLISKFTLTKTCKCCK